jgi:excinuclease ABC subunit B
MQSTSIADMRNKDKSEEASFTKVAEPIIKYMSNEQRQDLIEEMAEEMKQAAKDLEFEKAAFLRDEIEKLQKLIK